MFIALRELSYAKGRFLLMALVVVLVSFLVTILSGMSGGLIKNNISGLMELNATHIAFEYDDRPNYRNSMVEKEMWDGWAEQPGVKAMEPMGHTIFNARTESNEPLELVLWGLRPGAFIEPPLTAGEPLGAVENGVIVSNLLVARDGLQIGDTIILDRVLTELKVVGLTSERNIGHMPIVYALLPKWQEATYGPPGGPPPGDKLPAVLFDFTSVIALQLDVTMLLEDIAAIDDDLGTVTLDKQGSYVASTGYLEEVLSVQMIQGFLIVLSAVIIGAFFAVWTIQRTKEIGLVKALGASNWYLIRDALGQTLILMVIGTIVGVAMALGVGRWLEVAASAFPFMQKPGGVVTSSLALLVAGLLGGALAVRRISSVDPIIALGREQ